MALKKTRSEDGMAMVEMVIVLPLLLMLLFGIVEFAVAFGQWQVVSNAAREGARRAILFRDPTLCSTATVEAAVRQTVKDYAITMGITLADADISVTGTCVRGSPSQVVVTHPMNFAVLPNMVTSMSGSVNLVGRSVMRNE
jgi:Flp pilus assembly protein TadG